MQSHRLQAHGKLPGDDGPDRADGGGQREVGDQRRDNHRGRRELVDGEMSTIWKQKVTGSVRLGELGLEGDAHAYRGHGGAEKALLHYAAEHYRMWAKRFPAAAKAAAVASTGAAAGLPALPVTTLFGENIITFGMTEETVCLGDRYRIGMSVLVEVTQPRQPCWKLGLTAGVPEIPRVMQETASTGWFYRVLVPGPVAAGDPIRLETRPLPHWPLSRMILGIYGTPGDRDFLEDLAQLRELSVEWRALVEKRLSTGAVEDWNGRLYR